MACSCLALIKILKLQADCDPAAALVGENPRELSVGIVKLPELLQSWLRCLALPSFAVGAAPAAWDTCAARAVRSLKCPHQRRNASISTYTALQQMNQPVCKFHFWQHGHVKSESFEETFAFRGTCKAKEAGA